MADGDGSVAAGCALHQEGGQGLADDVAAPDDNHVLPGRVVAGAQQNLLNSRRRTGQIARFALEHPALVDGVQAVHVLARVNPLYGVGFVEMFGQGQLNQYAMERAVCVEAVDEGGHLLLCSVGRQPERFREYAGRGAGAALVAHVHGRRRVVAHQHRGQAGPHAGVGKQFRNVPGYLGADCGGQFVAVEDAGGHWLIVAIPGQRRIDAPGR